MSASNQTIQSINNTTIIGNGSGVLHIRGDDVTINNCLFDDTKLVIDKGSKNIIITGCTFVGKQQHYKKYDLYDWIKDNIRVLWQDGSLGAEAWGEEREGFLAKK